MQTQATGESLFEKLAGQFVDGSGIRHLSAGQRRIKSITDHLWRMFNTREGSVPHLPDYGLPDISEIYRGLPDSMANLEKKIHTMIVKYEPRLEKVRVTKLPISKLDFKLAFELTAQLKSGEKVVFTTRFSSAGETAVNAEAPRK